MHKLLDYIDVRIDEESSVKYQQRIRTKLDEEDDENNENEEQINLKSQEYYESGGEDTSRQEESGK
jgi:hypothetical protein